MYHFTDEQLILFLQKSKSNIRRKIIFSELERSKMAYILFKILSPLMPFSEMVKQDGLRALRRSFTKPELEEILQKSSIGTYNIQWKWAFRYLTEIELQAQDK